MKTRPSSRFFAIVATLLLAAAPVVEALAQCAMCAATVESNAKASQNSIGNSLNTGILYLMVLPYLMFGTIAFFWYKNAKKQSAKAKAKATAIRAAREAAARQVA